MPSNFVPFHTHPHSLDSASTPEAFVKREVELGTGHVAVSDHGSLAAIKQMFDLAQKNKLTYSPGLELYLRDDNCPILLAAGVPRTTESVCGACQEPWSKDGPKCDHGVSAGQQRQVFRETYAKYFHATVHFRTYEAYLCAVRLLTKRDLAAERHGQERKPIFNWGDIEELASHDTTMGSGCLIGVVSRHLLAHDSFDNALAYYERLRSMFRGRFFVEIFPHKTDKNWVQGVDVGFGDGTKVKYWFGKKLKTNHGELSAQDLAIDWSRKDCRHRELVAVRNYRTWESLPKPLQIVRVEKMEGYVENECRTWSDSDLQAGCNRFLLHLAEQFGDQPIVSDDAHYATPEESVVQDVRLGQSGAWKFYGKYHRQSGAEAFAHFRETLGTTEEEFERWVQNGRDWASSFKNFSMPSRPRLPVGMYPGDSLERTMVLIEKHGRMPWGDAVYEERLQRELTLFQNNGVVDLLYYFFPIEECCQYFADHSQLTLPGRGSAAGALLTYLLGITHADPIRYKLSLERFLTLDRIKSGSLPDIDQDLPNVELLTRKGGWLERRFGDCFAQISTDLSMKLRSSVKDVCRALHGRVPPEVEELTKQFVNAQQGVPDRDHVFGYKSGDTWIQGSIEYDRALQAFVQKYPKEWEIVQRCLGLTKGSGRHASAYLLCDEPISNFIPLTEVGGVRVTQYTAKSVEASGGVKYDFLGLTSGIDLSDAMRLIRERYGVPPEELVLDGRRVPQHRLLRIATGGFADIWDLPDDPAVYAEVAVGNTVTGFQTNTSGAVKWLKYFNYPRPDGRLLLASKHDMAIFNALNRPGPLDYEVTSPEGGKHNMLVEYTRRARGLPGSPDVLPIMEELLPETFGIVILQEQVQYSYQQLTGCSGSEAEAFRRTVAKKEPKKMAEMYEPFIQRVGAKIGVDKAKQLWESYITFSRYSFNYSHSLCYALIGYATAYLKYHYPLEWWTAVLSNATKDEIAETFWPHVAHLVDMPDVSKSGDAYELQGDRIRAPLSLVAGVGPKAHEELVSGRPYRDIRDFCDRVQQRRLAAAKVKPAGQTKAGKATAERLQLGTTALNRGVVYRLILAGVLDSLFPAGSTLTEKLGSYERALAEAQSTVTGKKVKPGSVDTSFLALDSIGRYQAVKRILPVHSAPLTPLVPEEWMPRHSGRPHLRAQDGELLPTVTAQELGELERPGILPEDGLRVAVVAYVSGVRPFAYKDKQRWEFVLDLDGGRRSYVYWGPRRGQRADGWEVREGAVVAFALERWSESRGFAIREWAVLREPLPEDETSELPRIWSKKHEKDVPAGAVLIDRSTMWGNRWSHLKDSTAEFKTSTVREACEQYEKWLPTQRHLVVALQELEGKHLLCHCAPKAGLLPDDGDGYKCHGQAIMRLIKKRKELLAALPSSF